VGQSLTTAASVTAAGVVRAYLGDERKQGKQPNTVLFGSRIEFIAHPISQLIGALALVQDCRAPSIAAALEAAQKIVRAHLEELLKLDERDLTRHLVVMKVQQCRAVGIGATVQRELGWWPRGWLRQSRSTIELRSSTRITQSVQ